MSTEPSTIAALDLGSNSFHMVIARVEQGRPVIIDTLKESVRLRQGLDKRGRLSDEACARALECLSRFEQRLRGIPRENIRVVGTNTLRGAKNARPFLEQIQDLLGVPVEVIAGREEARLIFLGVANQLPEDDRRYLVVDIGGGSTELIIGKDHAPQQLESRPMGCVSYSQEFFGEGKITKGCFKRALTEVSHNLEPHWRNFRPKHWDLAIGTSGTIKAIATVLTQLDKTHGTITRTALEELLETMVKAKRLNLLELPGLKPDRVPVFPGGVAILAGIFRTLEIEEMEISYQSLREGVLLDLIGREVSDARAETVKRMMTFYHVDEIQAGVVRATAQRFFPFIRHAIRHEVTIARNVLGWAADLHEIGMAIAHPNYHRHGAYILMNGDMAGFSRIEQGLLSFLVMNHRKSLKKPELPLENVHDWALLLALRLAVILHRERRRKKIPDVAIDWRDTEIILRFDGDWLEDQPLTRHDLEIERRSWKKIGRTLKIEPF